MKSYYSLLLCVGTLWVGNAQAAPDKLSTPIEIPISIIELEPASYPFSMFNIGIYEGWTKVYVGVDDQGNLLDALVIGYSHPDFGKSALEALHRWKFIPASINGKPSTSTVRINFTFNHTTTTTQIQTVGIVDIIENNNVKFQRDHSLIYSLDKLDRIPTPIHIVPPEHPERDIRRYAGRKIEVDFFIDETGKVRLPTLIFPESKEIVERTIAAVKQWRFEPPTYEGKAVITSVRQEFVFKQLKN